MKAVLNWISLGALVALGAGIWLTRTDAGSVEDLLETVEPDPAPVADTIPEDPVAPPETGAEAGGIDRGHTVAGALPGYFLPSDEIVYNGFRLDAVQAEPAHDGFEESLRIVLSDMNRPAGTNDRGETFYETVSPQIERWAVSPQGISVTASHPDVGAVRIEGAYNAEAYADWTSGAMSAEHLFTADVTIGGATLSGVPFSFWVGD
jgi:hypothetical protein